MIDLKKLQDKLNSDKAYAEDFVKDPVGILKKEGMELNERMQKQLIESLSSKEAPSGSSVGTKGGGILISIGIDY